MTRPTKENSGWVRLGVLIAVLIAVPVLAIRAARRRGNDWQVR